jgi:hypothetical protein
MVLYILQSEGLDEKGLPQTILIGVFDSWNMLRQTAIELEQTKTPTSPSYNVLMAQTNEPGVRETWGPNDKQAGWKRLTTAVQL